MTRTKEDFFMKKNEKRTYLSPETEVVRFNADIITTSGIDKDPGSNIGQGDIEQPDVTQPT